MNLNKFAATKSAQVNCYTFMRMNTLHILEIAVANTHLRRLLHEQGLQYRT